MASLGSFTAAYNPNLQTNSELNLPNPAYGAGTSVDALLNRFLNLKEKQRARDQVAALGQAPRPSPTILSPEQRFWKNKKDFDMVQSRDPWTGRAHGQAHGLEYFNMPAASALTFGKDIFPNGFDNYADILRSGGGVDPKAQGPMAPKTWGQGY